MPLNLTIVIEPIGDYIELDETVESCQSLVMNQSEADKCWGGTVFSLLSLIAIVGKFNFTYFRPQYFDIENSTDVWDAVTTLLKNETVDISAAIWSLTEIRLDYADYLRPFFEDLPERRKTGIGYVIIERASNFGNESLFDTLISYNVFRVFDIHTWITLFGLIVVFSLILGYGSESWLISFEQCFRILVNQWDGAVAVGTGKVSVVNEYLLVLWSGLVLVLVAAFSGAIYMATTIKPGWVQPFSDIYSMQAAGYRWVEGFKSFR